MPDTEVDSGIDKSPLPPIKSSEAQEEEEDNGEADVDDNFPRPKTTTGIRKLPKIQGQIPGVDEITEEDATNTQEDGANKDENEPETNEIGTGTSEFVLQEEAGKKDETELAANEEESDDKLNTTVQDGVTSRSASKQSIRSSGKEALVPSRTASKVSLKSNHSSKRTGSRMSNRLSAMPSSPSRAATRASIADQDDLDVISPAVSMSASSKGAASMRQAAKKAEEEAMAMKDEGRGKAW